MLGGFSLFILLLTLLFKLNWEYFIGIIIFKLMVFSGYVGGYFWINYKKNQKLNKKYENSETIR